MKSTIALALTTLAVFGAYQSAQASVTAVPVAVTAGAGDIESGGLFELLFPDNHKLVAHPTRASGLHRYDIVVTLANPLLAIGNYTRMEVRIEANTSNPVPLCRVLMQRGNTTSLIGALSMTNTTVAYGLTRTGNMNAFILPGGVVRMQLNGIFASPFRHRFDRISVTFS